MLKIEILAAGRLKTGPLKDIADDYNGKIGWPVSIHEIDIRGVPQDRVIVLEGEEFLSRIQDDAFVIVLDERGNGLRSLDFAETIRNLQDNGEKHIQFIIGGADGLVQPVRDRANMMLSFGQQTWPHMLVRVMLLEQIYRAGQILAGHPYHRE